MMMFPSVRKGLALVVFLFCVFEAAVALSPALASGISGTSKVAPGVCVLAPAQEYNHFLRKATVFLLEHSEEGSYGVNLVSPTMLTIGEAAQGVVTGPLAENRLYMGGEYGGRGALLLHDTADLPGAVRMGESEVYVGGIKAAQDLVASGDREASEFKFFFNVAKWGPGELQAAVDEKRWSAFHLPKEIVLSQDATVAVGDLWSFVKRSHKERQEEEEEEASSSSGSSSGAVATQVI